VMTTGLRMSQSIAGRVTQAERHSPQPHRQLLFLPQHALKNELSPPLYLTAVTKRTVELRSDHQRRQHEHAERKPQRRSHNPKPTQRAKHPGPLPPAREANDLQQSLLQDRGLQNRRDQRERLWKSPKVMIVTMSSSFGLARDGRDRPLWGIFLASIHISIYFSGLYGANIVV
jgi:hypothetical protein